MTKLNSVLHDIGPTPGRALVLALLVGLVGMPALLGQDNLTPQAVPEQQELSQLSDDELNEAFDAAVQEWKSVAKEMFEQIYRWHADASGESATTQKEKWAARESAGRQAFDRAFAISIEFVRRDPNINPLATGFLYNSIIYRNRMGWRENVGEAVDALLTAGPAMIAELKNAEVDLDMLRLIAGRSFFVTGQMEQARTYLSEAVQAAIDAGTAKEVLIESDFAFLSMIDEVDKRWDEEQERREAEANDTTNPLVRLRTSRGDVVVMLFEDAAPNTVANFIRLVEDGFYDGLSFYHVVKDQLAFSGDPNGTGTGHAGFRIPDEADLPNARPIFRGSLVMAKVPDPNATEENAITIGDSASSQFFISLMPIVRPEGKSTVFGRVIEGMGNVAALAKVDILNKGEARAVVPDYIIDAEVIRKRDHEYRPKRLDLELY